MKTSLHFVLFHGRPVLFVHRSKPLFAFLFLSNFPSGFQFEYMLESVLMARDRWLREGGVMWPSSAALVLVPCQADSYYTEKMVFWESTYGLDFTPLQ